MAKSDRRNALPKRSKQFGVGKDIGGNVYVHRQYESVLGEPVQTAKRLIPSEFDYTIIKLNLATQGVTFVASPDFDEADEPIVGRFILVREDGTTLERNQRDDPYIYHHKWLMVKDDYSGFDVAESKRRSTLWLSLKDVDKSRIGRKSFWEESVVPRLNEPADKPRHDAEEQPREQWVRSAEARKALKLSTCDLAHKRETGAIESKKVGNAFLYKLSKLED